MSMNMSMNKNMNPRTHSPIILTTDPIAEPYGKSCPILNWRPKLLPRPRGTYKYHDDHDHDRHTPGLSLPPSSVTPGVKLTYSFTTRL